MKIQTTENMEEPVNFISGDKPCKTAIMPESIDMKASSGEEVAITASVENTIVPEDQQKSDFVMESDDKNKTEYPFSSDQQPQPTQDMLPSSIGDSNGQENQADCKSDSHALGATEASEDHSKLVQNEKAIPATDDDNASEPVMDESTKIVERLLDNVVDMATTGLKDEGIFMTTINYSSDAIDEIMMADAGEAEENLEEPMESSTTTVSFDPATDKHQCPSCPLQFEMLPNLNAHVTIVHERPAITDEKVEDTKNLDNNMIWAMRKLKAKKNPEKAERTCDICNTVFSRRDTVASHKKAVHKVNPNASAFDVLDVDSDKIDHNMVFVMKMFKEKKTTVSRATTAAASTNGNKTETPEELAERTCDECGRVFSRKDTVPRHKAQTHKKTTGSSGPSGSTPTAKSKPKPAPAKAQTNVKQTIKTAKIALLEDRKLDNQDNIDKNMVLALSKFKNKASKVVSVKRLGGGGSKKKQNLPVKKKLKLAAVTDDLSCYKCKKAFQSKGNLVTHLKFVHKINVQ